MIAVLIRSIMRYDDGVGDEKYDVTAELRVYPVTSSGQIDKDLGAKLVKCGIFTWTEVREKDGSYYLRKVITKHFDPSTPISQIYDEFKKENEEWQAEFSKLMDKAIIIEQFIRLTQEGKNE